MAAFVPVLEAATASAQEQEPEAPDAAEQRHRQGGPEGFDDGTHWVPRARGRC